MADTYTPNTALVKPAYNDAGWNTLLNADFALLDALAPIGGLCVTTNERPTSTSLVVAVAAGVIASTSTLLPVAVAASTIACTASATNYIYLLEDGTLHKLTTGWPTGAAREARGRRRRDHDDHLDHRCAGHARIARRVGRDGLRRIGSRAQDGAGPRSRFGRRHDAHPV